MSPTSTPKRQNLAAAWGKTHERVVGGQRPAPPEPAALPAPGPAPRPASPPGGFKHLNLRIPSDVHKNLRKISIDDDKSLKAVVIEALTRYAAAHGKET